MYMYITVPSVCHLLDKLDECLCQYFAVVYYDTVNFIVL